MKRGMFKYSCVAYPQTKRSASTNKNETSAKIETLFKLQNESCLKSSHLLLNKYSKGGLQVVFGFLWWLENEILVSAEF